jgi:Holliday junction resolvase
VRKIGRTDTGQREIVQALRDIGASVEVLSGVGNGCPDLLVGWRRQNYLLEVKSEKGSLTQDQVRWWRLWGGDPPYLVRNVSDAYQAIGMKEMKR